MLNPLPQEEKFNLFCQLVKVDEKQRVVYGRATQEVPDGVREIMDYDTSKPNFSKWSEAAKARTEPMGSNAMSLGNVREMHQPIAAGKLIDIDFNDVEKAVDVGAYISNDDTWKKILDGTLTGFSVGGKYAKRWPDRSNPSYIRYTADPAEISVVDSPAVPTATFKLIKADGSEELRKVGQPIGIPLASGVNPNEPRSNGQYTPVRDLNAPTPAIEVVKAGADVQTIPTVAGNHVSPTLIDNSHAVEPISQPRSEPVEKLDEALQILKAFADSVSQLVALQKLSADEKAKVEAKLTAKGQSIGIARKDGEPLTPPSGYPNSPDDYGDPANWSWPYDTEARVKSAISYFNGGKGLDKYDERERNTLGRRIATRATSLIGKKYTYSPKDKEITSKDSDKMELNLDFTKVDLQGLLSQVQSAVGVITDQIGKDPEGARDLLLQLAAQVTQAASSPTSADTNSASGAPTGSQEGYRDAALKTNTPGTTTTGTSVATPSTSTTTGDPMTAATATPPTAATGDPKMAGLPTAGTSPSSSGDSSSTSSSTSSTSSSSSDGMDKFAALEKRFDDLLALLQPALGKSVISAQEQAYANDLAALIASGTPQEDPVLKALLADDKYALIKAAQAAGTPDRPDREVVFRKASEAAAESLRAMFSQMMVARGYNNLGAVPPVNQ